MGTGIPAFENRGSSANIRTAYEGKGVWSVLTSDDLSYLVQPVTPRVVCSLNIGTEFSAYMHSLQLDDGQKEIWVLFLSWFEKAQRAKISKQYGLERFWKKGCIRIACKLFDSGVRISFCAYDNH